MSDKKGTYKEMKKYIEALEEADKEMRKRLGRICDSGKRRKGE